MKFTKKFTYEEFLKHLNDEINIRKNHNILYIMISEDTKKQLNKEYISFKRLYANDDIFESIFGAKIGIDNNLKLFEYHITQII